MDANSVLSLTTFENINDFEKIQKLTDINGMPPKILTSAFMYIRVPLFENEAWTQQR